MADSLEIYEVINNLEDLEQLREVWRELVSLREHPTVFLTFDWYRSFWATMNHVFESWGVIVFRDTTSKEVVGLVPYSVANSLQTNHFFSCRGISLMNDFLTSPDHVDALVRPGREEELWDGLVTWLTQQKCSVVSFTGLYENSPFVPLVRDCKTSYWVYENYPTACPYNPMGETYEETMEALGSKFYKKMRRERSKLVRHAPDVEFHMVTDQDELDRVLEIHVELHNQRLREIGEESDLAGEANLRDFFYALGRSLLKQNRWVMHYITIEGKVAVTLIGLRYENRICLYSTGFDKEYHRYSLGSIALQIYYEWACKEGIEELDLLRGDQPYKLNWAQEMRRDVNFILFRKNLSGLFLYTVARWDKGIRRVYFKLKRRWTEWKKERREKEREAQTQSEQKS